MRFIPDDTHASGFQVRLTLPGDRRFSELMRRRDAAFDAGPEVEVSAIAGLELEIARMLLLANYDITNDQVAELLQFSYDEDEDPEGKVLRDECMFVAVGRGKKASPAGIA
jgi:hypothetical protein